MSQTILLVEDDADLREAMSALLEAEGFEVAAAPNGMAGLKLLERIGRPCLILLDWWLPLLSGSEFLSCLRADPQRHSVPVVVLTASEAPPPTEAEGFLRKPFESARLLNLVHSCCTP
ncbi:response regulator [Hyalangium rubrum]|uniref:Response regulator n=1 Tax=Hyalangium rubrum TaxID=3103134 RepID=A0ABU5H350_9BACT|nr:response regulator [Hyalangium sp. s54d21]MDY7227741.1 response regulator [Hyalangium sp. s54d21]